MLNISKLLDKKEENRRGLPYKFSFKRQLIGSAFETSVSSLLLVKTLQLFLVKASISSLRFMFSLAYLRISLVYGSKFVFAVCSFQFVVFYTASVPSWRGNAAVYSFRIMVFHTGESNDLIDSKLYIAFNLWCFTPEI